MHKLTRHLPILILTLAAAPTVMGATYHLDCSSEKDRRQQITAAASVATTFADLEQVNAKTFSPGDQILLRRGTRCRGMLWPKGSGSAGSPITLGAYGVGAQPVIDGGGSEAVIKLFNQEYWHIENIETVGGSRFGIYISGDRGVMRHFRLTNVTAHDVTGQVNSRESGLIIMYPQGRTASFEDVIIDGATAYQTTQWSGIHVKGANSMDMDGLHGKNITIRNSLVHDVYGDGIIIYNTEKGLIEKSVAWKTGLQATAVPVSSPNGIWTWQCNDCTVRYTEGFLISSYSVDGGVYDIDCFCRDNVIEYNYGHDAKGYCLAVFACGGTTTSNSIVRYNVCANNGRDAKLAVRQGDIFLSTWEQGKLDGVKIHDNVVYWNPAAPDAFALHNTAEYTGTMKNTFEDNVIISKVPNLLLSINALSFDRNRYWQTSGSFPRLQYGFNATLTDFAEFQKIKQDVNGKYAPPERQPTTRETSSNAPAPNQFAPGLLALLDDSDESHSQTIFLRSMKEQYESKGLKITIFGNPSPDWRLDGIPVLPAERAVGLITVTKKPATILIDAGGNVVKRWEGFASAQELGLAIQKMFGLLLFDDYQIPGARPENR